MAIPDKEMVHRCEEFFGLPSETEVRSEIAGALDMLAQSAFRVREALDQAREPGGHQALFSEVRHGG